VSFNDAIGDKKMVESVNNSVRAVLQQSSSSTKPPSGERSIATQSTSDGVDNLTSKQMASELSKKPPVDLEAVNRIKAAIKRGEYPINLDVVAEELMNSYIEMKS
jgi:negative regulator of flagellin synthesis FlgM